MPLDGDKYDWLLNLQTLDLTCLLHQMNTFGPKFFNWSLEIQSAGVFPFPATRERWIWEDPVSILSHDLVQVKNLKWIPQKRTKNIGRRKSQGSIAWKKTSTLDTKTPRHQNAWINFGKIHRPKMECIIWHSKRSAKVNFVTSMKPKLAKFVSTLGYFLRISS